MVASIPAGDLPRVTDRLEKTTGKLLGVLYNVHEEVQRVGKEVREDYEAKLADVVAQYTEYASEQQYRIDGYEEENQRVAALLQREVLYRRAPDMHGEQGGAWGSCTVSALLSLIEAGETYEVEKLNA